MIIRYCVEEVSRDLPWHMRVEKEKELLVKGREQVKLSISEVENTAANILVGMNVIIILLGGHNDPQANGYMKSLGKIFGQVDKIAEDLEALKADDPVNLVDIKKIMDQLREMAIRLEQKRNDYAILQRAVGKYLESKGHEENVSRTIQGVINRGVEPQLAEWLVKKDPYLAPIALEIARKTVKEAGITNNDEGDKYAIAIWNIFKERGYSLGGILEQKKYEYKYGIPDSYEVVQIIADETGLHLDLKSVPGVNNILHLRRMKTIAIIAWLLQKPFERWLKEPERQ